LSSGVGGNGDDYYSHGDENIVHEGSAA
jgi:hypothetical protein